MTDTTVKYFDSTMSGAPAPTNAIGQAITWFDAVLVDGFGTVTLDSLVVSSGVATGSLSTGHGFTMFGDTYLGPVIAIAGATPSGLNGEWRIASVADANTFTFACPGISDGAATGTITAKIAPLGWTKLYSGTNKAVYQRNDITATDMVLRVEQSVATYTVFNLYESMSDVDTGVNASDPVSHAFGTSPTLSYPWRAVGDGRLFYITSLKDSSDDSDILCVGDINSYIAADAYGCVLCGNTASGNSVGANAFTVRAIARNYLQTTTGPTIEMMNAGGTINVFFSSVSMTAVDPYSGAVRAAPAYIREGNVVRGRFPGLFLPWHAYDGRPDVFLDDVEGAPNMVLRPFHADAGAYSPLLQISGPWR